MVHQVHIYWTHLGSQGDDAGFSEPHLLRLLSTSHQVCCYRLWSLPSRGISCHHFHLLSDLQELVSTPRYRKIQNANVWQASKTFTAPQVSRRVKTKTAMLSATPQPLKVRGTTMVAGKALLLFKRRGGIADWWRRCMLRVINIYTISGLNAATDFCILLIPIREHTHIATTKRDSSNYQVSSALDLASFPFEENCVGVAALLWSLDHGDLALTGWLLA